MISKWRNESQALGNEDDILSLIQVQPADPQHLYFFWMLSNPSQVDEFIKDYDEASSWSGNRKKGRSKKYEAMKNVIHKYLEIKVDNKDNKDTGNNDGKKMKNVIHKYLEIKG